MIAGAIALPLALGACAGRGARAPAPADGVVWDYDVRVTGGAAEALDVEARFAPGGGDALRIDDDMTRFVSGVLARGARDAGDAWKPAPVQDGAWTAPCREGCVVRYRVALRDAALALHDAETAIASGDATAAPPSSWLLHPDARPGRLRFRVTTPPGVGFVTATRASRDVAGAYEVPTEVLESTSFAMFGAFHAASVVRGATRIDLAIAPARLALSDADVATWIGSAVDAIGGYYGRFPVDRALVVVMAGTPGNPTRGLTLGDGGPGVLLRVGDGVTAANVRREPNDEWVATHELLHVTLPSLTRDHAWLSEGIPSYVEPLARARAGLTTPEKVWRDLIDGLPQGLPEAGDEGLERTHTWGRTYWGGSLFCLVADVAIREATGNARSLDDALRAVIATGDDVEQLWPIERLLDVGDRATGTTVLHDVYARLGLAPGRVDLDALWARLGVHAEGSGVRFDDGAPLAALRRSMTAGARKFFDETGSAQARTDRQREGRP